MKKNGNPLFGKKIRQAREKLRHNNPAYSLRKSAVKIGVSPTFLSKLENGEFAPPSADKIIKIAKLLNLDADELLALARKIDPQLSEIIRKQPKEMAKLLRTISGTSAEQLKLIINKVKKLSKSNNQK